jgi:hypothetical protein
MSPLVAHVGGLPIEEALGSFTPALVVAFGVVSATLRDRVRRTRGRRAARVRRPI